MNRLPRRDLLPNKRKKELGVLVQSLSHALVAIAVSLNAVDREMIAIRNIFLVSIPGALLLVAGGAWLISGSALRPIERLNKAIEQVTVNGLDRRVPIVQQMLNLSS
ncbi:HAMP domain-containing protein [Scytonema sp. UIC 10036]|nr:HAMP domain-containing protein [Scytonema sp. UIC 10036]